MAKGKKIINEGIEREYVVPLRARWLLVQKYRRSGKAAKSLKEFIAKHMKVENRDIRKVKLDTYLNEELWFRGKQHPPAKIKVKAKKEGEIVRVRLAEPPEYVKIKMEKADKLSKSAEAKKAEKLSKVVEKKEEVKSEEQKQEEEINEDTSKEEMQAIEKMEHKVHKKEHEAKGSHKENTKPFRQALKK
jgi:large subunit ribosomal protein L31e